jgi:hypothetical protein
MGELTKERWAGLRYLAENTDRPIRITKGFYTPYSAAFSYVQATGIITVRFTSNTPRSEFIQTYSFHAWNPMYIEKEQNDAFNGIWDLVYNKKQ